MPAVHLSLVKAERRAASIKIALARAAEPQHALFRERYRPRSAQAVPSAGAGATGTAAVAHGIDDPLTERSHPVARAVPGLGHHVHQQAPDVLECGAVKVVVHR